MRTLNYGLIGNCRSAALVSDKGAIEWFCLPKFDSPSIFAKILDEKIGGEFAILTSEDYKISQQYMKRTNLLLTRFDNGTDAFEITDFMPRYMNGDNDYYAPPDVIRYFRVLSGKPKFRINYNPKMNYALGETNSVIRSKYIKSITTQGDYDSAYMYSSFDFHSILNSKEILLSKDEYILLSYHQKLHSPTIERSCLKLERTKVYWLNWADRTQKYSQYNDEILRSALVLKLLTYNPSGAILAAVTTSLPETIGEERNWDYRFCWMRDASMTIKVLSNLGHLNVARRYLNYILKLVPVKDEPIQIMYGINGEKKLSEKHLDYLDGYEGSKPVRIGNAAYKQKQNDIYGVLVDVIYQLFKRFDVSLSNSEELWTVTRSMMKVVQHTWRNPDRGIWEIRNEQKHFTFSKLLCWVAMDRGAKIANMINMPDYVEQWSVLRDEIKQDIMENAWNESVGAFTQTYASKELDASNLLMQTYGFISADDPKFQSTVHATEKALSRDGLMYRYKNTDDFGAPKSSFTICTFWLITALYRIGEKARAKAMFERVLSYSNHLGLFSEDIDFETKALLGNFPQAYSHLALIETAITISEDKTNGLNKEKLC
ncbi:MAG: glycoside hydrolase family 15 protein [Bacteroidota bacterium]|nr:glycoside hydrolase family 15 protein [Bacteroidota bacterium]